jgi:Tol biopolymer transport system component
MSTYTVDPSPSGIEEQKIYAEPLPESNFGKTGVGEVSWSPDGSQILYVQDDSELSEARLMLIPANSTAVQILNTVEDGRILSPIWARDGAYIYFGEQLDVSTIYALEMATGEKRPIYTDQTQVALQSLSPDETWLVVANANQYESADLALVSLYSEMVIDIPTETMNGWIGWQSLE